MGEPADGPGSPAEQPEGSRLEATAMIVSTMAATLTLARALLIAGHRIDLDGVEREVADLCAETVELPREEGHLLRPALVALLREVEALEDDLLVRVPGMPPAA